jgi:hypothetical protein
MYFTLVSIQLTVWQAFSARSSILGCVRGAAGELKGATTTPNAIGSPTMNEFPCVPIREG